MRQGNQIDDGEGGQTPTKISGGFWPPEMASDRHLREGGAALWPKNEGIVAVPPVGPEREATLKQNGPKCNVTELTTKFSKSYR